MILIEQLPERAAQASLNLRDAVLGVLGDDVFAMWLHGGTTFPDRPRQPGDLDLCVVVDHVEPYERRPADWQPDPDSRPSRLVAVHESFSRTSGFALDLMYLRTEDVGEAEPPGDAFWEARQPTCWPISRAHWLAGQYVHLHGRRPDELVIPPTEAELRLALDRELEHLERHVYEGDAKDPYEATYAVWNGCRILYTLETGSPVVSKRSAGAWGLEHLPESWHATIRAAGRAYDGGASPEDIALLRDSMGPFVEMLRERLPITEERPPGPPRWS